MQWRESCRAHTRLNEYQLRKRSLVVNVYSETRAKAAILRLNLYQISVGPYHQDFQVNFSNGCLARISLDVKISQLIELDIRPAEITIGMAVEHPGEEFHYTLRTVVRFSRFRTSRACTSRANLATTLRLNCLVRRSSATIGRNVTPKPKPASKGATR